MRINLIYPTLCKWWSSLPISPTSESSSQRDGQGKRKKIIVGNIKKDHNGKYIPGSLFDIVV